jgi:hypothetical protein
MPSNPIPKSQRDKLAERSGGNCELCALARATNWHHRKNRSQGGQHTLSNAMHLCGSGTTGCHGMVTESPARAYDRGWSVRSGFDPADVPVVYAGNWALLSDDGTVFRPPTGHGRCVRCGFHVPTQGHRAGCQEKEGA